LRAPLCTAWLLISTALPAGAQTVGIWPEVDVYVRLNSRARLFLVGTTVKDDGERTDAEFGPSLDLFLKPIRRVPQLLYRLDESKNSVLMIRSGYRYLASYTGGAAEHRGLLEATARYPLTGHFGNVLLSNRNRMDFRVIDGAYSWRYRNRLSVDRELSVGPVRINPYVRFEGFYDSRFAAFSRTETMVGASFPITRYWELEGYFDYQLDTGNSPNQKTRAVGAVTTLYF
jgi:hypothetical protein